MLRPVQHLQQMAQMASLMGESRVRIEKKEMNKIDSFKLIRYSSELAFDFV